jgi:hypothetical protein
MPLIMELQTIPAAAIAGAVQCLKKLAAELKVSAILPAATAAASTKAAVAS